MIKSLLSTRAAVFAACTLAVSAAGFADGLEGYAIVRPASKAPAAKRIFFGIAPDGLLTLAAGGTCGYTVVHPDNIATGDVFVVRDVAALLSKAAGCKVAVKPLSSAPAAKRIFYGIAPEGFSLATLEDQEHCVFTEGDDVHLFGGGANGARYAAYSMLQKDLGFRFFDAHGGTKIPSGAIRLKRMKERRKFPFKYRYLNGGSGMFLRPESTLFLFRHGQNSWSGRELAHRGVAVPQDECRIKPPHAHSLRWYLPANSRESTFKWIKAAGGPDLEKTHPEYFSMDENGRRVFNHQYCLSNAGCRKLLKERLLENMRRSPEFNIFDLSAGDTPGVFCHCPGCKAMVAKYGTVAGPLVDFIIEVCPEVERLFPSNLVMSLVYRKEQTQPPPKGLDSLPPNFMPDFAPIDDNFAKEWTDPSNARTYADLKEWSRLCRETMVWYYPNPYGGSVTPPLGNVERAVTDLKLMKEAGVTAHIWEHNVGVAWMIGFTELQSYVFIRLMHDLSLDWRSLADEFIDFEYGAAGEGFRKYWLELEDLRKREPLRMRWNASVPQYRHLTPERLARWQLDFDAMEAAVKDDPARLYAIRRVRLNLDSATLAQYAKVRKAGFETSFDDLAARMTATVERVAKDFCNIGEGLAKRFVKGQRDIIASGRILSSAVDAPLPADLFGKYAEDRLFVSIPKVNGAGYEKDPKAAFGVCAVFTDNKRGAKLPMQAVLEDFTATPRKAGYHRLRTLTKADLPPRGEYRFYNMGTFTITPDCDFRIGAHDWYDLKTQIGRAWEEGSFNRAEGWMSLKFEGEEFYPEDKGRPGRVLCDRVVIVRK